MTMQEQDYEYFLENTARFYKEYGQRFLTIKNQNVIGVYDSFNDALDNTLKKEPLGTFLIQECLENRGKAANYFQGNVAPPPARGLCVGQ
jgi:hypothetical protein